MKTGEEMSKEVIERRNAYKKERADKMKKATKFFVLAVVICALSALGLFFGKDRLTHDVPASTTQEPSTSGTVDAVGGDDHEMSYAYDDRLYSLDYDLADYIEKTNGVDMAEWLENRTDEIKQTKYNTAEPEYVPIVVTLIREFNIPREEFEAVNGMDTSCWGFTEAEVDVIYGDDAVAFTQTFAADDAIVANGRAFAPYFYLNASDAELAAYGIDRATVTNKALKLAERTGSVGIAAAYDYFNINKINDSMENERLEYDMQLHYEETVGTTQVAEYFGADLAALEGRDFMPNGLTYAGDTQFTFTKSLDGTLVDELCEFNYEKEFTSLRITVSKIGIAYNPVYSTEGEESYTFTDSQSGVTYTFAAMEYDENIDNGKRFQLCVADFQCGQVLCRVEGLTMTFDDFYKAVTGIAAELQVQNG